MSDQRKRTTPVAKAGGDTVSAARAAPCALCGLPVATGPRDAATDDTGLHFCCAGCGVVYGILHEGEDEGGTGSSGIPPALILRFGVAAFLAFNIMVFSLFHYGEGVYGARYGVAPEALSNFFRWVVFGLSVPAVWLLAAPQLRALRAASRGMGRAFHALVLLSVGAAMGVSIHAVLTGGHALYFDTAVMLLLLVTLGQLVEGYLRTRATGRLDDLLAGGRARWTVRRAGAAEGELTEVAPDDIAAGDRFVLRPGDRMPIDGRVVAGDSETDTECRDGELMPSPRRAGDAIRSGELNLANPLEVEATPGADAAWWVTFCGMARGAFERQATSERLAARVAGTLLPATISLAFATFGLWWWATHDLGASLLIALSVLVVACPCAMGLATPIALRLAVGEALRLGALPRDAEALERLAGIDHVVVDYTGTMTARRPAVTKETWQGGAPPSPERQASLRRLAGQVAERSKHPVAAAVVAWAAQTEVDTTSSGAISAAADIDSIREEKGRGMSARLADGSLLLIGSADWLRENGAVVADDNEQDSAACVFVAHVDSGDTVRLSLDTPLHPATARALEMLLDAGLRVSLLTGAAAAPPLPSALRDRLAEVRARCRPEDKLRTIESHRAAGERVAMIGDGLNDLPALQAADVGIAAGGLESATEAIADVVLTKPGLATLPALMRLARKTRRVIVINFAWLIGYNAVALGAAAAGMLHPLLAAVLMVLSSTVIVGHSFTIRPRSAFNDAKLAS